MVPAITTAPARTVGELSRADASQRNAVRPTRGAWRPLWLLAMMLLFFPGCDREGGFDLNRTLKARPAEDHMVFDYVGVTQDVRPSVERHLTAIRERYKIEILIVVLPSLGDRSSVTDTAVQLFSN